MGYRSKALVLALFCLLAVSTLLTTSANVVAKEEGHEEEGHVVVDAKKGLRKVLNEKTVEPVGKATNDQDIPPNLEDEKHYRRRGYRYGRRRYRYGHGRYGQGGGRYGRGGGRYGRGGGRYGHGHGHGHCHHC